MDTCAAIFEFSYTCYKLVTFVTFSYVCDEMQVPIHRCHRGEDVVTMDTCADGNQILLHCQSGFHP